MATRQWIVTANGTFSFNSPVDWQFGAVPGAIDIAEFNSSGTVFDTITGNATIAELLVPEGSFNLAGNYTISGAQATELSLGGVGTPLDSLTILPGASVSGNKAVSVDGSPADLAVLGTLVAGSLTISNLGRVAVDQGSSFEITGQIIMNNGALDGFPAPGQNAGPAIAIDTPIAATGTDYFSPFFQQEIDLNGVISGTGLLDLSSLGGSGGIIALNGINTYSGGTKIESGLIAKAGNANAFGTGTITINGELLATTTETIANPLSMTAGLTIAAAHGQTLTIGSGGWILNANNGQDITFGAPGQDGTVVFKGTLGGFSINPGYGVVVQAGTLEPGADSGLVYLVGNASLVTVQAGATLDSAGSGLSIGILNGAGRLTNSGALKTLTLGSAGFSGTIDGAFALNVTAHVLFAGSNSYTGGTTIANGGDLTLGLGAAAGSVAGSIVDDGMLDIARSDAITLNNVSGTGVLNQKGSGTTTLGSGLSYSGGTFIYSGTLAVGDAAALGSGNLTIGGFGVPGGELLATATETISGPGTVTLQGNATIAAAHGQTLTINPQQLKLNANAITIGAAGQDGVVSFVFGAGINLNNPGAYTVTIAAGTLKADPDDAPVLLGSDATTTVQSGATLDMAGVSFTVHGLQGAGSIINSGAGATLTLNDNVNILSGVISGVLSLVVGAGEAELGGDNTFAGTTTVNSGALLVLGSAGTSGSVAGSITDNGLLYIYHSDTFTLHDVSGTGGVIQYGSGTTILGTGLFYSGGTTIDGGTLSVGNPSALGSGPLTIDGGELLASATETISNKLTMSGDFTIAAAHGQTLTMSSAQAWTLNAGAGEMINFGATGQDGTVVFDATGGDSVVNPGTYTVAVQAGTLKAGDGGLGLLLLHDGATVVQAGATLDTGGFGIQLNGLTGAGHITDSGAAATLSVNNGNFAGTIDGPLALSVSGNVVLAGATSYTGGTTINNGAELTLGNGGATGSVTGNITDNGMLAFDLYSTSVESGVISGAGSVWQEGSGTTVLTQTNTYSGWTFIAGGTLELQKPGSAGGGGIAFLNGGAETLRIDGTTMPTNTIYGLTTNDTIDLANVAFVSGATATVAAGNVLKITEGGNTYNLNLDPAQTFAPSSFFVGSDGAGGTIIVERAPLVTSTNQTVGYNQAVPLSNLFSVAGSGVSLYQVWFSYPEGGDPADGQVTDNGTPIATDQWVTLTSLSGLSYIGAGTPGSDHLWLRAYNGQWSSAAQAVLTDPGVTPDTITAHNQSVASLQPVSLASIFTVAGATPSQYQLWLTGPSDGAVTDSLGSIALNTAVNETSLSGINYIGGISPGSDALYLRAFDGQWSSWVLATLTNPGATPDTITATNQSVAYNQSVGLASIFSVAGPAPSKYQVWLNATPDGSVTDSHGAIASGVAVDESSLSGVNYIGSGVPGSDAIWLRAWDGAWSSWVQATLTDPGVTPDTISAINQSIAYNQVVGLSSLFSVAGPTPSQYQLWFTGPGDGSVTDSHGTIATSTAVNETSLSGINYIGGATPGSDLLYVRSFDGQWSPWILATLTDPGVAADTITGHNLSVAANQSVALSSLFAVSGPTPSQYQVWLSNPADGSVTDGIGAIATGTAVNETSLSGVNFIGGAAAGSDAVFVRSFDGQWSSWIKATLTDIG